MEFSENVKVWVTCPEEVVRNIQNGLGEAGISTIGNYTHCSFVTKGKGYFKPNKDAQPHVGEVDKLEEVDEVVLEFVCHKDQLSLAKEIINSRHPYEEVALDVFPMLDI